METNSTNKLITIAEKKGIKFLRGDKALFKKYSYVQVINAYKNLFAYDEDTIDEIKENIDNGIVSKINFYRKSFQIRDEITDDVLYENICNKICKKYGLEGKSLNEKEAQIKIIKYHHHIYNSKTLYTDFVRMYKFEHELRMMLLKYTLIIEESIKNIFISYLNDKNAEPNYLVNMDNYNTTPLKSKSFDTIKLIIDKYDNQKSKPIKRKRDQHLTVPYWVIINELAMNQTYYAIANLNTEDSYKIFLRCLNFFTKLNFSDENRGKSVSQINYEKKMVNNFKTLLCYLGEFRNMLAHNQPIYCYNIASYNINATPKFEYELPKAKPNYRDRNGNIVSAQQQQVNLMGSLMNSFKEYFGNDSFNANNSTKLDLSKIIYILYKILKYIDHNTNFYKELITIYSKYNIILNNTSIEVQNADKIVLLKNAIEDLNKYKFESIEFITRIKEGKSYKKDLKLKEKELNEIIKNINTISKNIRITEIKSKYKNFPVSRRYSEFTGIDLRFFNSIK